MKKMSSKWHLLFSVYKKPENSSCIAMLVPYLFYKLQLSLRSWGDIAHVTDIKQVAVTRERWLGWLALLYMGNRSLFIIITTDFPYFMVQYNAIFHIARQCERWNIEHLELTKTHVVKIALTNETRYDTSFVSILEKHEREISIVNCTYPVYIKIRLHCKVFHYRNHTGQGCRLDGWHKRQPDCPNQNPHHCKLPHG